MPAVTDIVGKTVIVLALGWALACVVAFLGVVRRALNNRKTTRTKLF